MDDQTALAALKRHNIKTVGDLDDWALARKLSRPQALDALVGTQAADRIIGVLAVNLARKDYQS